MFLLKITVVATLDLSIHDFLAVKVKFYFQLYTQQGTKAPWQFKSNTNSTPLQHNSSAKLKQNLTHLLHLAFLIPIN